MLNTDGQDSVVSKYEELRWQELEGNTKDDVVLEAKRYCPEFPFEPVIVEQASNLKPFYTEDYQLVRLSSSRSGDRREVWGFYALGDFHPLDGSGRVFEELNQIAPLDLNRDTVLDYALTRLRFELPQRFSATKESSSFRCAEIVANNDEVPAQTITQLPDGIQLTAPRVVVVTEQEGGQSPAEQGIAFRVIAFATVYVSQTEWELVQALVQIQPDGELSLSRIESEHKIGHGKRASTEPPVAEVFTPLRTRTALPIREWLILSGPDREKILGELVKRGINAPPAEDESAPASSTQKGSQDRTILRLSELPFYQHWKLLEILLADETGYRRSYALVGIGPDAVNIEPLDGTSPILHQINRWEQLNLTAEVVDDYLRFFCWAVHSDGPFYIPNALRAIPLLVASKEQIERLKQFNFTISDIDEAEAAARHFETTGSAHLRKAFVVYESAMFEAWFAIEPTGMVEMLEDQQRVSDLKIYKENYNDDSQDLFKLKAVRERETFTDSLTLVNRVILHQELRTLSNSWEKLVPRDKTMGLTEAPEIKQPLKRLLEQLPEGATATNDALRFLLAQVKQSEGAHTITATTFLKSLAKYVKGLRPPSITSAQGLHHRLARDAVADSLDISDSTCFDKTFVSTLEPDKKDGSSQTRHHFEHKISKCWFQETVRLVHIPDITLTFEECVFEQGVIAEGAQIGKELTFIDCAFQTTPPDFTMRVFMGRAFNLQNASISAPLLLRGCQLAGSFYAPGLQANANVQLESCGIASNLSTISEQRSVDWMFTRPWPVPEGEFEQNFVPLYDAINLVAAKIEGNLEIGGSWDASMIYGSINANEITVGKAVDLSGTSCQTGISLDRAKVYSYVRCSRVRTLNGPLSFQNATIESDISFSGAIVNGYVSLYLATVGGNVTFLGLKTTGYVTLVLGKFRAFVAAYHTLDASQFTPLSIGGDLVLSGAEARFVEIRGAEISGNIEIFTGKFGRLILALGAVPAGIESNEPSRTTKTQFVVKPCSAQAVVIGGIEVEENLNLSGLNVRLPVDDRISNLLKADLQGVAISITYSRIGRDLTFFTERLRSVLEKRSKTRTDQRLPWQTTPSPPDCRATAWGNLDLKANEINGTLDLRNMNVQGDIDLNHTIVKVDVNADAGDPDFEGLTTECKNLIAEKLDCSGDLKLSGIKVLENFSARQAKVKGEIVFVRKQVQKPTKGENLNFDQNPTATIEGDLDLTAVEVNGDLDLRNLRVGGDIQMSDTSVGSDVALLHTQCKNLRAEKLDCQGDLRLSGIRVRENLGARQAKIKGQILISTVLNKEVLDHEPATEIPGQLDLCSVDVSGGLELKHLRVGGAILVNDATVRRDFGVIETHCESLSAEKLDCSGDVKLSGISLRETLRLRQAKIKGGLSICSAPVTNPSVQNPITEITGGLDLCSMQVSGGLELHDLKVSGDILVDDTHVGRNFDVFKSQCSTLRAEKVECLGDVRLSAVTVTRNLRARQARIKGELLCLPAANEVQTNGEGGESSRKHSVKITGDLDLISLEVSGSLDLRNLNVTGDILVNDSSIGRDFNIDGNSFSGAPTTCNDLNAEGLKCNGELNLSGLHAKGDFRGRDIQVGGDITFLEMINPLKNANGNGQLRHHAQIGGSIDLTAAKTNRLSVSGSNLCEELRIQDLNLPELLDHLRSSNEELPLFIKSKINDTTLQLLENAGHPVELQESLLKDLNELIGDSSLFERRRFAKVNLSRGSRRHLNELDQLTGADIKRLNRRLLEDSYGINSTRVTLERSQIGHLEITKPPVLGRANLTGISVTRWEFSNSSTENGDDPGGSRNASPETVNPDDYINLLNESFPFDRSVWINVEKYLRNQSLVAEANRVYREMRRRIKNDAPAGPILTASSKASAWVTDKIPEKLVLGWTRATRWISKKYYHLVKPLLWHAWDRTQYASIGYSTRVWIPMVPALVLFVISLFVFHQQHYVRASPALLQVLEAKASESKRDNGEPRIAEGAGLPASQPEVVQLDRHPASIPGVNWGWGDAMVLTLRYHVPILTSLTHNWWEASGQPIFSGFTAEHYAFLVQVYHWIAWPLFLLGAAAQVFRGKQD